MPNLYVMGHSVTLIAINSFEFLKEFRLTELYKNYIKLKLISNILREVNFTVWVTSAKISKFVGRKNKVSLVLPESFCILSSFCPNLLQEIKILREVNIRFYTLWTCLRRLF